MRTKFSRSLIDWRLLLKARTDNTVIGRIHFLFYTRPELA
jgi:hypothetical protein